MEYLNSQDKKLFEKGLEIYEVCKNIVSLIPKEDQELSQIAEFILADALNLSVKVAGVSRVDSFDLKMEAAVIIRKSARDLKIQYHSFEIFGLKEFEYFNLVRGLIDEYKILFIEWVSRFKDSAYSVDEWGLFKRSS